MSLSFKNAKNLENPWTHWFFFGATGSGKTTLAATFPRPIFILPKNEGSIATLRGQDIPYYEVIDLSSKIKNGVGGMNRVIDELEALYKKSPDDFPFDTIVIESTSHYADLVIEDMTAGGRIQMNQGMWGVLAAHFRNIQSRLRNMDVHVVFTALDKVDKADDGTVIGGPLIPGQTAKKLPSSCDVIGYCELAGGKNNLNYRVHFRKYKAFDARSRFDGIPAQVENFNFADLEKHLV